MCHRHPDINDGPRKQVETDPKSCDFWRTVRWRTATKMGRKEKTQAIDDQKENNQILVI